MAKDSSRSRYKTNQLIKSLTKSLAGGEIAPELIGRLDLEKWQTALKECTNWLPTAHGPIRTRPGTKFVNHARNSSKPVRIIPFQWSITQSALIELGEGYVQIHVGGATQYNVAKTDLVSITVSIDGIVRVKTSANHLLVADDVVVFSGIGGSLGEIMNGRPLRVADPISKEFNLLNINGTIFNGLGKVATIVAGSQYASVYKISSPYLGADLADLAHVQSSDVITLSHDLYKTRELKRQDNLTWTLEECVFEPTIPAPVLGSGAPLITPGPGASNTNTARNSYVVTAVTDRNEESEPSEAAYLAPVNVSSIVCVASPQSVTVNLATAYYNHDPGCVVKIYGLANTTTDEQKLYEWLNGKEFEVKSRSGTAIVLDVSFTVDTNRTVTYASGAMCDCKTSVISLDYAGARNRISWDAVPGAAYYHVYKASAAGASYGYIGKTDNTVFTDNNITPDAARTAARATDAFDAPGDYPRTCAYYEQRRIFAGTLNNPQTVWMTKTGTESNLLSSVPSRDNDAIRWRMDARDHNSIQHIVPMNDMIILTSSGEWRAYTANGEPITPKTLVVRPQSFAGCSRVTPAVTKGAVIYCQYGGYALMELSYSWESQTYRSTEITAMVPHMLESATVVSMAFQRVPIPVLWCVMSDGTLMSCTYMPEHKVVSFARHITDGDFESVAVVAEDGEDGVYFVIKRLDNEGYAIRNIERLSTLRQVINDADQFQVDSGLTLTSATGVDYVTGLWHLEGKTVSILVDGAVHPQRVVQGGRVDLDYIGYKITIGLPFRCQAETLPLAYEIEDGGISNVKNVNQVYVRVRRTSGLLIGSNLNELIDTTMREYSLAPGSPPERRTGVIHEALIPEWDADGTIFFVVDDPVQASVMAIGFEASTDV